MTDDQFPQGKIHDSDEGEVALTFLTMKGNVVVDFGKPVVWVGMPPQQAVDFANRMIRQAREAAREAGVPLTVMLDL